MKILSKTNNEEFQGIIKEFIENKKVQEMRKYPQHFNRSCFAHCYRVSYYCYCITKKLNWDFKSITRAGMLHDFFLYDWRKPNPYGGLHGFKHGRIACENACELFDLSEKEKNMIMRHMFPVTLIPPKSKEGLLLTFVDKYCALVEMREYFTWLLRR